MTGTQEYTKTNIKDSEDVYYVPKLNVKKKRKIVQTSLALLAPLIGQGADSYTELQKAQIRNLVKQEDAEDLEAFEEPDFEWFSLSAVLANQVENPLVEELQDLLIEGVKVSEGGEVSPDKILSLSDYDAETATCLKTYTKILINSFKENAYGPLVECLNDMGYSTIVGSVQAVVEKALTKV